MQFCSLPFPAPHSQKKKKPRTLNDTSKKKIYLHQEHSGIWHNKQLPAGTNWYKQWANTNKRSNEAQLQSWLLQIP